MDSKTQKVRISSRDKSVKLSRYGRKITPKKNTNSLSCSDSDEGKAEMSKRTDKDTKNMNFKSNSTKKIKSNSVDSSISPKARDSRQEVNGSPDRLILPKTPYSLRQRLKNKIQLEVEKEEEALFSVSEESEWDECGSDSSESEDEVGEIDDHILNLQRAVVPDTGVKHEHQYVYDSINYLGRAKVKTSSEKLTKLLDARHISEILSSYKPAHSTHISSLNVRNESLFYKWLFTLSKGFNLLIYGLGSKKILLENFRNSCLNSCRVLVVNGFFPGLTIKEVVSSLFELLEIKGKENVEALHDLFEKSNAPQIFIIVHNIDGVALRTDKAQSFLAKVASYKTVHLIASVDHINAPLLWDQKKLSSFKLIWEDCTTFLPYTEENSFESSLMVQRSGSLALSSLQNVYRSLNKNSRNIFKLLLENCLDKDSKSKGMPFSELYRLCRRNFIVSSDLALRTQLTEFIDHQLIKWKKETDTLTICVEHDVLKAFKSEIDFD